MTRIHVPETVAASGFLTRAAAQERQNELRLEGIRRDEPGEYVVRRAGSRWHVFKRPSGRLLNKGTGW